MSWLLDLIEAAQVHTWVMVLVLWLTVVAGGKLLHSRIEDNGEDLEKVQGSVNEVQQEVHTLDVKQDHIVERQEVVLDKIGVNSEEIQELHEETTRLDAEMPDDDRFYRGSGEPSGDD